MAGQSARPGPIKTVLIDLDDCMYRVEEMPELVRHNIERYMEEKLHVPHNQRVELCKDMYMNYGTTMAGLQTVGFNIDFEDWHREVHGTLPYKRLLKRDPELRQLLLRIKLPKYVFTNADIKHAETCLDIMGVRDCFDGIICFESIMEMAEQRGLVHDKHPVLCKPHQAAIQLALEQACGATAATTLYLDDSTRNIAAGHEAGMHTVLVGRTGADCPADQQVASILDLPSALPPQIWVQLCGEGTANGAASPAAPPQSTAASGVVNRAALPAPGVGTVNGKARQGALPHMAAGAGASGFGGPQQAVAALVEGRADGSGTMSPRSLEAMMVRQ